METALDFLMEHYGRISSIIYPPEDGLIEVFFYPYQPDGSEEPECTGWVQVDDECWVLDAQGRSLDEVALKDGRAGQDGALRCDRYRRCRRVSPVIALPSPHG